MVNDEALFAYRLARRRRPSIDDDFVTAALVVILAKQLEAEAKQPSETVAGDFTAQAVKLIQAKQVTIQRQLREASHR